MGNLWYTSNQSSGLVILLSLHATQTGDDNNDHDDVFSEREKENNLQILLVPWNNLLVDQSQQGTANLQWGPSSPGMEPETLEYTTLDSYYQKGT